MAAYAHVLTWLWYGSALLALVFIFTTEPTIFVVWLLYTFAVGLASFPFMNE